MREQLKCHDEKADSSPWINALGELRPRATREGHCNGREGLKRYLSI
jgi:hypothetical protein